MQASTMDNRKATSLWGILWFCILAIGHGIRAHDRGGPIKGSVSQTESAEIHADGILAAC